MAKKFRTKQKITLKKDIDLRSQVEKDVSKVNARLKSLSRRYDDGTWASKKLMERLDGGKLKSWKKGRVKIPKKVTNTQLKAIDKALNQFLLSKTSTKKGISDVKTSTLESLKSTLSLEHGMSDRDIESAYEMLSDKDAQYFAKTDKLGASTMWSLVEDAIEGDMDEESFVNTLLNHMRSDYTNDLDVIGKAKRLYQNYVL